MENRSLPLNCAFRSSAIQDNKKDLAILRRTSGRKIDDRTVTTTVLAHYIKARERCRCMEPLPYYTFRRDFGNTIDGKRPITFILELKLIYDRANFCTSYKKSNRLQQRQFPQVLRFGYDRNRYKKCCPRPSTRQVSSWIHLLNSLFTWPLRSEPLSISPDKSPLKLPPDPIADVQAANPELKDVKAQEGAKTRLHKEEGRLS